MPFLVQGSDATVVIPANQSISIGALRGSTAGITIPTGLSAGPIGIVNDAQRTFGPYPNGATVNVLASKGSVEYVVGLTPITSDIVIGSSGFDFVIDVTTGDAASIIQSALNVIKTSGRRSASIKIRSTGAFNLTSGIVVNPWFHNVDFCGAVVTYTPTTGNAVSIECDRVNVFTQLIGGVHNINLVGGKAAGNTSIGLYCYGTAPSTRTSCAMYNITIDGFNEGLTFDDYAYLTHFYGIVINGCRDYGLNQRAGANDAGENISLHGGAISNCAGGAGTAILCSDDSSEIILYGMSVDYNLKCARIVNGGRVYMSGGHIEFNGTTTGADQFYISDQSTWSMDGVYWVVNTAAGAGPYTYSSLINVVDTNSSFIADKCKFTNHRNTADLWAIGNGKVIVDRVTLFNNSLMPYRMFTPNNVLVDGGFEQTTIQDLWYVTSQGGTYSNRFTKSDGTAVITSTDTAKTGSRSLKVSRGAVGAGYACGLRVMIPVSGFSGKTMFCNLWANSTLGANTVMSFYQAILSTYDANGIPTYARRQAYAAPFQTTNIPNNWTTQVGVQNGSGFRVAPWATHIEIEFDISAGAASTSLYIDDFTCEFY